MQMEAEKLELWKAIATKDLDHGGTIDSLIVLPKGTTLFDSLPRTLGYSDRYKNAGPWYIARVLCEEKDVDHEDGTYFAKIDLPFEYWTLEEATEITKLKCLKQNQ